MGPTRRVACWISGTPGKHRGQQKQAEDMPEKSFRSQLDDGVASGQGSPLSNKARSRESVGHFQGFVTPSVFA